MADPDTDVSISVALCTFNSVRFVEEQLISILDQELAVAEVVIGDDGSTDGTLDLISAVAARHVRGHVVRVAFTTASGGVTANFSRTLAACTGDVIALADHDDVWDPNKTAVLVPQLTAAEGPAMIFTDARIVNDQRRCFGVTLFEAYGVSQVEIGSIAQGRGAEVLIRRNIVTGATAMLTRDLLNVALPIPPLFVHDEWLAFLAASVGTLLVEEKPLIDYRVHGSNQIGIPPSTLLGQARIAARGTRERYEILVNRAEALSKSLASLGAPQAVQELIAQKAVFETKRASMPRFMPARLPGILRRYRDGSYQRFTHRPSLERWRDLVQRM